MLNYIYKVLERLLTFAEVFRLFILFSNSLFILLNKYFNLRKEIKKMTVAEAKEFLAEIEQVTNAIDNLALKVKKLLVRGLLEENK